MAHVINMKHASDLAGAVRIDRRTVWGNPYRIGADGDRATVIARYRRELWRRIEAGEIALADLAALSGKTLACWCAPEPCHGDVLARAAEWAARRLHEAE